MNRVPQFCSGRLIDSSIEQSLAAASAILLRRQQAREIAKIQRLWSVASCWIAMGKSDSLLL
jgi:hypothetical protein